MSGDVVSAFLRDAVRRAAPVTVDPDQAIQSITAPPKITRDTQPTLSVRLWRCTVCGKWSHAKRQPRHHQGWRSETDHALTYVGGPLLEGGGSFLVDGLPMIEERAGTEDVAGGWMVECGPFEEWEAWKVEKR